jgi:hypothetical protein
MPSVRFAGGRIACAPRQTEAGATVGETCRKVALADATPCRGKTGRAGTGASGIRRQKRPEEEDGGVERPVADLTPGRAGLQDSPPKEVAKVAPPSPGSPPKRAGRLAS